MTQRERIQEDLLRFVTARKLEHHADLNALVCSLSDEVHSLWAVLDAAHRWRDDIVELESEALARRLALGDAIDDYDATQD